MMVPKIAKGQKWCDALTGDCCEVVVVDLIGIILRGPDHRLRILGEEQLREAYVYQIPICTERLTYDDAKTKAEAEGGQLPSTEYGRPELPKPRCHAPCQVWRHVGPSYIEEAIVVSVKYPSGAGPAEATLHVYHNGIFVFTVRRWDNYFVGDFVGYVDPGGQPFEKTRLGDAWRYGRPRPTREEAAEKNFDDGAREVYPGEVKYDIKSAYPDPDALIRALILEEAKSPPPFVGKDAWLSFLSGEYERTRNEKRARGRGATYDDAKFIALRIKSWREAERLVGSMSKAPVCLKGCCLRMATRRASYANPPGPPVMQDSCDFHGGEPFELLDPKTVEAARKYNEENAYWLG